MAEATGIEDFVFNRNKQYLHITKRGGTVLTTEILGGIQWNFNLMKPNLE